MPLRVRGAGWLLAVVVLAGCGPVAEPPSREVEPRSAPSVSASRAGPDADTVPAGIDADDDAIDSVLAVSVDGLNPAAVSLLGPSRAPTFHRLMRQGAWTLNARTAVEQTRTLPNHTSMLTGRRIDRRQGGHGFTINRNSRGTIHDRARHYVPGVFDVVHDHGGRTALFTAKSKFSVYANSWNAAGADDRVGADSGRAKIDRFVVDPSNRHLVDALNADLRGSSRQLRFLHLSLPDKVGHQSGFMSPAYLAAVQRTDQLLGLVLATIESEPGLRDHLLVVLTADHGGSGAGHDAPEKLANLRIPFLAWGPGVPAGTDLYRLNPTRRDPGTSHPTYDGPQPVRNGDLANLVTDVLDLPPVPGSQLNADQQLDVFAP